MREGLFGVWCNIQEPIWWKRGEVNQDLGNMPEHIKHIKHIECAGTPKRGKGEDR